MPGSGTDFKLNFNSSDVTQGGSHSTPIIPSGTSSGGGGGGGLTPQPNKTLFGNVSGGSALPASLTSEQAHAVLENNQFWVDDYGSSLANLNSAIAALNAAGGGTLKFGPGTYSYNGAITPITVSALILGCGLNTTFVAQASSTENGFTINSTGPCVVRDICLQGGGAGGSGNGISFGTNAIFNQSSIVDACQITGFSVGTNFINAAFSIVRDSTIGANGVGLAFACPFNPDESAGMVVNCTISANTTYGISLTNADGLQVIGNYIQGGTYAYHHSQPNRGLIDFFFTGNHIENQTSGGLFFTPTGSSSAVANIVITGNEFACVVPIAVDSSGAAGAGVWLARMIVVGNHIGYSSAGNPAGIALYYSQYCTIAGNTFDGNAGNPGIYIDSTCSNCFWDGLTNVFDGTTAHVTDNQTHTVATLIAAATAGKMARAFVTDSNTVVFAAIVAGGGAGNVPVYSDGANWRVG